MTHERTRLLLMPTLHKLINSLKLLLISESKKKQQKSQNFKGHHSFYEAINTAIKILRLIQEQKTKKYLLKKSH